MDLVVIKPLSKSMILKTVPECHYLATFLRPAPVHRFGGGAILFRMSKGVIFLSLWTTNSFFLNIGSGVATE